MRTLARRTRVLLALLILGSLSACAGARADAGHDRPEVVTTTGILADIARHVAGDRARVTSLVPDGVDPQTYEPTLRAVRDVVYADVAFSNYAMLEQHSVTKTLEANLRDGVPDVALAEESVKYAAELIPLVENPALDTIWLGLRVVGTGARYGATRVSDVRLSATAVDGPGRLVGYLTGSFGDTDVYFDSGDGFEASTGYRDDTAVLPPDAHTHMSWAFSAPGTYRLRLAAAVQSDADGRSEPVAAGTFTFAVGVDPSVAGIEHPIVLDAGHADLTVDLGTGELLALVDGEGDTPRRVPADRAVIVVPHRALAEIPDDPHYAFLGTPGTPVFQLPQAVLGNHVHGEIDPHLWHDVRNAEAYAKAIRDTLIEADPAGAADYVANARAYLVELDALDREVRRTIAAIPVARRHLVTTHNSFAYLAEAYGLDVAGFVTPSPATEPSLADRRRLTATIRDLHVPAVFLEPELATRPTTLSEIAHEEGIRVCTLHGDTLDRDAPTYADLMRGNAASLRACLG